MRHSVITMNDDCTQVSYATIIMNLEKWRAGIQFMINTATELLKEELLLELNAFYYSIVTLANSSADLNFGHSFLDDFKNQLYAVRN